MSDFENLDYYELLGVSRSASPDEIKRAYRQEISKYHPDRFANAAPAERAYASRRSQRITEAYSVLSDFASRTAYNRGQKPARGNTPPRPAAVPVQPRDHQAELYEQAQAHLAAGRTMQAIGVLRQLQQLNPFYRDSAELLASAEAQAEARRQRSARAGLWRPLFIAAGLIGGVALVVLAAWSIGMRGGATSATGSSAPTNAPVALAPTDLPTQAPVPTPAPIQPTAVPTTAPTRTPQPTLSKPTTAPPTPVPATPTSAVQPSAAPAAEQGTLLFADAFATSGWADLRGTGWRVGYQRGRYRIAVDPGIGTIWSYRTGPSRPVSIGVDVQVASGEGGLLLRFVDANNYLSFSVNPQQTSFRLEQHSARGVMVLTGGQSEAIQFGTDKQNRLVARLLRDHIQLLVNGQLLADLDMAGAGTTRYGLLAISSDTAAEVFFDNLEIRALE